MSHKPWSILFILFYLISYWFISQNHHDLILIYACKWFIEWYFSSWLSFWWARTLFLIGMNKWSCDVFLAKKLLIPDQNISQTYRYTDEKIFLSLNKLLSSCTYRIDQHSYGLCLLSAWNDYMFLMNKISKWKSDSGCKNLKVLTNYNT